MGTLLLFDLGGVVVDWSGIVELAALSGQSVDAAAAQFASSPIATGYERGEVDDNTFTAHMIESFNLPYSPAQFKLQWRMWVGEPFDDVIPTIKALGTRFTTACLSNTNAMHWDHLAGYVDVDTLFHHSFASHQIGAIKPEPRAFDIVCERTGFAAKDIVFFDDSQINIDAARAYGITAHKVDSDKGLMPTLSTLRIG